MTIDTNLSMQYGHKSYYISRDIYKENTTSYIKAFHLKERRVSRGIIILDGVGIDITDPHRNVKFHNIHTIITQ